jgi:magnesium-transporting ATPase (P-type)
MKYIGLTNHEVKQLLKVYGYNTIKEQKKRSLLSIFREQINDNFMVYFMVGAALLSFFV